MRVKIRNSQGSVLTIILVTVVLIGITLASYLQLVSNQNRAIVRSQQWNAAIAVAEAGIEEALAHLNTNGTNRLADGWTLAPDGTNVTKERIVGDGKYRVLMNLFREPPLVMSEGYVKLPGTTNFIAQPRTIRTGTIINPLFAKGLVAKGQIDLNGNNIATDSFDSSDPAYNTAGGYDSSKNKDNGDVATNSSLVNSVSVGNANIMGRVSTGPGGSVSIGPNGMVGSKAFHANPGNNGDMQLGWVRDDMNVEFPDVEPPYSSGWSINNSGGNKWVGAGDYYEAGSIGLSGKAEFIVKGHARVFVKGDFKLSGKAALIIEPGASLELYVAGATTSISGNGVVNQNSNALSFGYWGLPSNTAFELSGNGTFTGTVYAPSAHFKLNGGGSGGDDFIGAAIVSSAQMNGHFKFHYDEALGKFGPKIGYLINSWNETYSWTEI